MEEQGDETVGVEAVGAEREEFDVITGAVERGIEKTIGEGREEFDDVVAGATVRGGDEISEEQGVIGGLVIAIVDELT